MRSSCFSACKALALRSYKCVTPLCVRPCYLMTCCHVLAQANVGIDRIGGTMVLGVLIWL